MNTTFSAFTELNARVALSELSSIPVCGQNIFPLLVRGDTVVCAPYASSASQGKVVSDALHLSQASIAALHDLSRRPRADAPLCLALPSATLEHVTLFCRLDDVAPDAYFAITLAATAKSACRVLLHSFADRCELTDEIRSADGALRAADENTYALLGALMDNVIRPLHQGLTFPIHDRRELCRITKELLSVTLRSLAVEASPAWNVELPLELPFEGSLCLGRALWMLCCLVGGILHRFPRMDWQEASLSLDDEHLLPTLHLPVGSRAALPAEWVQCQTLARQYGLHFSVQRKRREFLVHFCPATPNVEDAEAFFRLCVPPHWSSSSLSRS